MKRGRPDSVLRLVWVIAVLAAIALSMPVLWHQTYANPLNRLADLEVYRDTGRAILDGRAVYELRTPPPQLLPFTYPPLAAVAAVPLALVSFMTAAWIWQLASLALLAWLIAFCFRPVVAAWQAWLSVRIGKRRAALAVAALAPMLLPLLIWLEPVRTTFRFGQVNIIIAALVVADCCTTSTRLPRGVLVGIATAIKLTPGLFIPYLWLSGRKRAAYVATATFVGCQLVAAVAIPGDSREFWTDSLFHSGRLGNNRVTANVAIRGALLRLRPPRGVLIALLVVFVLAALVVGVSRALLASRGGAELAGVTLIGLTSVAISPVSWDHHLIWLVPAFAVLLADPGRLRRLLAAVALGAFFYTRVPWWSADLTRRTSGVVEAWWRGMNMSFTIATFLLILMLPLKSLSQLPKPWSRGDAGRAR